MTQTLREKVEAITSLKDKYGIGSQDAFRYLNVQEQFGKLRGKIINFANSIGFDYQPSAKNVSNLCSTIEETIYAALKAESLLRRVETKSNKSPMDHYIEPYSVLLSEASGRDVDEDIFHIVWNFDYETFIKTFVSELKETNDRNKALKAAFREFANSEKHYLETDGTSMSFSEFKKRDDLMFQKFDTSNDLIAKFFGGFEANSNNIDISTYRLLTGKGEGNLDIDLDAAPAEEFAFVLGSKNGGIYRRAKREGTLGRLEVERKIAMHEIHPGIHKGTIDEVIENRIKILTNFLKKNSESLGEIDESDSRFEFLSTAFQKESYVIRALRNNRKWLREFFKQ